MKLLSFLAVATVLLASRETDLSAQEHQHSTGSGEKLGTVHFPT
jgi:hypothetical protein